jgi:hypothetical protein
MAGLYCGWSLFAKLEAGYMVSFHATSTDHWDSLPGTAAGIVAHVEWRLAD